MSTTLETIDAPVEIKLDLSRIQTEDDTPVDNLFSEREQRLLVETLYAGWKPKTSESFIALANVGLFYGIASPPIVPDMLLSLDVVPPQGDDVHKKEKRSYFIWEYEKPPELVVEIVSNRVGGEFDDKKKKYARIGVLYYIVHDPELIYGGETLVCYMLQGKKYVELPSGKLDEIGLEARLLSSRYEGIEATWLRWHDGNGALLPTGEERAAELNQRAEQERQRAEQERQRAEQERQRAEKLAEQLRRLGYAPDAE